MNNLAIVLFSLLVSFFLCYLFWPRKLPVDVYFQVLSPVIWKEADAIYQEIEKIDSSISQTEHERILAELLSAGVVECNILRPTEWEEIESPNDLGRTHIDVIKPWHIIVAQEYRLTPGGGKRITPSNTHSLAPIRI